jgi:NTE family protein
MRIFSRSSFAVMVLCFFLPLGAFPQASSSSAVSSPDATTLRKRLKIGIALEGGGALGLAHIGVLKWFEDHHIPVDYIAGTSMGGLVGGLYATGKTPAELKGIVENQDWIGIIDGQTDYRDLSYRRKEDRRAFPNRLEFGLKNGFSLPSGLNSGQGVSLLIDRETLSYSHNGSFDNLPIPFRCVATDLVTGRPVVFDHGSIAQAMRSTMSLPGLFAPVRIGQDVYVDGGLLDNLPTDVVRKMGADVVIAIHLEIADSEAAQLQSLFSALGRSVEVVIHQTEIRGLAGADLVVNVDLKAFTTLEYEKAAAIIDRGSQATADKSNILSPYALNDADWKLYLEQRQQRMKSDVPVPQFLEVRGTNPQAARSLEHFLRPLLGKPIDVPPMEDMLNRLTGIGKFDSVDYWLEDKNGQTGLIVNVHEKSYAPPTVQLGFEADGSEPKDVTFTQAGRLTFMDVAGYRSEWRTDFAFGNTYRISSELYRPFNALSKWFLAPHLNASNTGFKFFAETDPIALYRYYREDGGIDLGYGFSRFTELRVGYDIGYTAAHLNLGRPDFASVSGRLGDTHLNFQSDHTDDPIVPRLGYKIESTFHWYDAYPGSDQALPAMDARFEAFKPISSKGSVFASAEGGTTFGVRNSGFPIFFLGAPLRLSAYGTNELFGDQYYLFRAGYIHELITLPPFVGKKVYVVGSYEFAKMYRTSSASNAIGYFPESGFPTDVEAGVVAETAFGPLFFGGSVGDSGHQKWFFQLGRVF